ncbi:MAG: hypothetical protein H6713_17010 [Myxococcales bacterium]|nr:hypothetical protein [Myxococcales bacterium]
MAYARPLTLVGLLTATSLALTAPACGGDEPNDTDAGTSESDGESDGESSDGGATTDGPSTDTASTQSGSDTDGETTTTDGTSEGPTTDPDPSTTSTSDPTTDPTDTDTDTDTGGVTEMVMCGDEPPPGAQLAPPLPTYGGICPTIETGIDNLNVLPGVTTIFGNDIMIDREFMVFAPDDIGEEEQLPVIFMWHWLGGDAKGFANRSEVEDAVNFYRFIAVIPNGRDIEQGLLFKWPFSITDSMKQMEQDFQFFEDMLACVAEQFGVDKECVSSTGVSAGALFTDQLAGFQGDRLSSIISLSGGTGGLTVKPWTSSGHIMPAMVLWGGPDDFCIAVDFNATSLDLEQNLQSDGHFVVECIHNCTHATPPFDPPMDIPTYSAMWRFFLDHPYWLEDGASWYTDFGLPDFYPEWCAVGVGNAEIRVGECGGSECQ